VGIALQGPCQTVRPSLPVFVMSSVDLVCGNISISIAKVASCVSIEFVNPALFSATSFSIGMRHAFWMCKVMALIRGCVVEMIM
jgi:hypothetical protein